MYGSQNTSVLHTDEDLRHEVEAYLQAVGKFVCAEDIVKCMSQEHLMVHLQHRKPISVWTAQQWMKVMGYQWQMELKGQYADGHE